MRLNQFVARSAGLSRRQADNLIQSGQISVNGQSAVLGQTVSKTDDIKLGKQQLELKPTSLIMLNKPAGYVCSKSGQGANTVYELLPAKYNRLNYVGRLDKNTTGLLLFTDDGELANSLTHPRYQKIKTYRVVLDDELGPGKIRRLREGVKLEDGISRFISVKELGQQSYQVELAEGKNRQIRRTFEALGRQVMALHRTSFGPYQLGDLKSGQYQPLG